MAIGELRFLFFDVGTLICSDSEVFLAFMGTMYTRFMVKDFPPIQTILDFHYYTGSDNPWGEPTLALAGEIWRGAQVSGLAGYVYDGILNSILSNVRSYLLIHAGVVSKQGKATILTADSGGGKTTMVLGLVQRGYQFLSDELAPLPRQGGLVDPFPRSLRLRPGYHRLLGLPEPDKDTPIWFEKYLLEIEQIKPGSLGSQAQIGNIIILKDSVEESHEKDLPGKELGVFVNRLDEALIESTRKIPGVLKVWQTTELGYPVLRFRAEHRMQVLAQVEQLCQEGGIMILDVSRRPLHQPSFAGPARLVEIPKSQAVFELIRQYQPGHKSRLITEDYHSQASRLFLELAGALGEARCFQLTPGPLNEMVDLVCGLEG